MRVELAGDIFPIPPSTVQLDALASLALSNRHRLLIEDDTDARFRQWFDQLTPDHREEWKLILADGYETEAREPARRALRVTPNGSPNWAGDPPELPLPQAVAFLQLPFLALIEDWSSDRAFVLAVASPEERAYLVRMEERGALLFDHGGGITNMPNRVSSIASSPGGNKRLWVLFDHDGLQPGVAGLDSARLAMRCVEKNVPHHQLARRSIENYITPEALRAWATGPHRAVRTRKVRAFMRMNEQQRFHFSMKSGFAKDAKRTDATAGSLFDGVSDQDFERLAEGFGDGITELLSPSSITEIGLKEDGSWTELSHMMAELVALVR